MFSAVARLARGPVELTVGVAFERRFRLFAIDRRGLTFDTRFAPPVRGSTDALIVYMMLDGTLEWARGPVLLGPALFVMRERDFEGARGSREGRFRSWGTPFRAVELRVSPSDCSVEVAEGPAMLALDPDDPVVSAARLYLHASLTKKGQTMVADLAAGYVTTLRMRGVLMADLAATMTIDEGLRGILWEALRPSLETFGAGVRQEHIVSRVGWNPRTVQRELTRMAIEKGVGWMGNWRDVSTRYRVRVAVMLLSNPELSVGDAANLVGYASIEALAHALDACGLPSATELRRLQSHG
jgi:AraC-like DNA-binding protein